MAADASLVPSAGNINNNISNTKNQLASSSPGDLHAFLSQYPKVHSALTQFSLMLAGVSGGGGGNKMQRRVLVKALLSLLRQIIGETRWSTPATLMVLLEGIGRELSGRSGSRDVVIENVVRRVMCCVRREVEENYNNSNNSNDKNEEKRPSTRKNSDTKSTSFKSKGGEGKTQSEASLRVDIGSLDVGSSLGSRTISTPSMTSVLYAPSAISRSVSGGSIDTENGNNCPTPPPPLARSLSHSGVVVMGGPPSPFSAAMGVSGSSEQDLAPHLALSPAFYLDSLKHLKEDVMEIFTELLSESEDLQKRINEQAR